MRSAWLLLIVSVSHLAHGAHRPPTTARCQCNGKALYCVRDNEGLRCLKCQENTEGRQCEGCKEGFYHQRAGQGCLACNCNPTGSQGSKCDTAGQCRCKDGYGGKRCDVCANGAPLSATGCAPLSLRANCRSRAGTQSSADASDCLPCFCNGHSSDCIEATGYSVHNISSSFQQGTEGWHIANDQGFTPSDMHFRWSRTYGDLEAISKDILPMYFYAPSSYLGNQVLSYGQTLSFDLRLDRGVRRPSVSDVVLKGAGLQISASLGDLRSVLPCAKKITYTFRLDELPGSKWKPQLSPLQFQTLLSNLTAIMIRGTFGDKGRGYLDNVNLVSARKDSGPPAGWVERCNCPAGYEGQFCERCAPGYKRNSHSVLSSCEPCACQAGSCDPETGDCYSSDGTSPGQACPDGSYRDSEVSSSCLPCPCPTGSSCSMYPGSRRVECDDCPPGTMGPRCQVCADGFYGDPLGERGSRRPCKECQCNGHVDLSVEGSCDSITGECLRCLNNTRGVSCESCLLGYYHSKPMDACKECDCDPVGSESRKCNAEGQCRCKEGYEGRRCHMSSCPSCFNPLKTKIDNYAIKVREIQGLFNGVESGKKPVTDDQMERAMLAAEEVVAGLQKTAEKLSETERGLEARLNEISKAQVKEDREVQALADVLNSIKLQEQQYTRQVSTIQALVESAKQKLQQAKQELQEADFPQGDGVPGSDSLTGLAQKASTLAQQHQRKADYVEKTANSALSDAEKALSLMRTVMTGENAVKELAANLKAQFEKMSAGAKALEAEASGTTMAAMEESSIADDTLRQISSLGLPLAPQEDMESVSAGLTSLKEWIEGNMTAYRALQQDVDADQNAAETLLAQGLAAQQEYDKLVGRVDDAKALADSALAALNNNTSTVEEALDKLRGFDERITENKGLAEEAIAKLPAINATIRDAVETNTQTLSILDSVNTPYNDVLTTIGNLGDAVTGLEGLPDVLKLSSEVERDVGVLRGDVDDLQGKANGVLSTLKEERAQAEAQKNTVEQAAKEASAALENAQGARDAVGDTLQTVNDLLNTLGTGSTVDQAKVDELKAAITAATARVRGDLLPRLRDLEDIEARQKATLSLMNADMDAILADISNLEEIRDSIPRGCFNAPPIERP